MTKKDRLFFVGIKHSGKTTLARLVSEKLKYSFSDGDDLILQLIKPNTVREFYSSYGKDAFMAKEREAVEHFIKEEGESFILSLGGGASDNTPLMEEMKREGTIIYLKRNEEEMLPVILEHGIPAFLDKDDLEGSFHRIYTKRDRLYSSYADIIINLKSYGDKGETAELIYSLLKEKLWDQVQ